MSAIEREPQPHAGRSRGYARAILALAELAPKPAELIQAHVRQLRSECARYRTENRDLRARIAYLEEHR